jgi:hypothetical protein
MLCLTRRLCLAVNTKPVGAGLPAKASSLAMQGSRPPSLASQLLQGFALNSNAVNITEPVGAWLAREEAGSFTAIDESKLFSSTPVTFAFSFGT